MLPAGISISLSPAYYAMFYIAQAFLLGRGLRYSKHSAVIAAFGQEFAKSDQALREFHHGIVEAQDARTLADYQIEVTVSAEDVQAHLDRADRFIRLAEKTLSIPAQ